jgi:ABC-type transport system involved in cytochrome bd biosynthesis fused ATPase/permease subunit
VLDGIDELAGDRGVLIITHRSERLDRFDYVLTLEDKELQHV